MCWGCFNNDITLKKSCTVSFTTGIELMQLLHKNLVARDFLIKIETEVIK